MILLLDNYDSFTYNLYQQIAGLGQEVTVVKHDLITIAQIEKLQPSHIVISPGPKTPKDSGISMKVIDRFYKTVPILGICLGHQCIGEVFGSKTVQAPTIVHGKSDKIHHEGKGLFEGLPNPIIAARYHSLVMNEVPDNFVLTAWSSDQSIMAVQHDTYPVYGLQFHPESFMTEHGNSLMKKFLACKA